jgi:hypothetical protein
MSKYIKINRTLNCCPLGYDTAHAFEYHQRFGRTRYFKFTLKIGIPGLSQTLIKGLYGFTTQIFTVEIFTQ